MSGCTRCKRRDCPTRIGAPTVEERKEARIDCWRSTMHAKARLYGLTPQVEAIEQLRVHARSPIRPFVVIVPHIEETGRPLEHREGASWSPPIAKLYDLRGFAYADRHEFTYGTTFNIETPKQVLVDRTQDMIQCLAIEIARHFITWAS